jgi:hypothetical protein
MEQHVEQQGGQGGLHRQSRVRRRRPAWWLWVLPVVLAGVVGAAPEETASDVPVSRYAPIQDIRQQLNYFFDELRRDLADEAQYDADHQGRVANNANTLAVLAQTLANYDADVPEKKNAAGLLQGSLELAGAADSFAKAKAAWAKLEAARTASSDPQPGWEPVADLAVLMKQVPIVNNSLRSGVTSRRFERSADRTAGFAATLAAIAQASSVDFNYCSGPEDEQEWRRICVEMRDACADVNQAIRKLDQAAAQTGLDRIVKTCDACHHRFRD